MHSSIVPMTDRASYELFVVSHSPQALFQSWDWGEVQKRIGGKVERFGLYEDKALVGVFQTAVVRAKRGSFIHVRHGPIIRENTKKRWNAVLQYLKTLARKESCWFVRISPLLLDTTENRSLVASMRSVPAAIHSMDGEYCWVLDVEGSEEALLSGMRKSVRYDVRRADKSGVEIYTTTDPKYLAEFFRLYDVTSKRHGFVPHKGIREEFELFAKKRQALLYLGKAEGTVISAAIILFYGNQAIYHHGASQSSKLPVSVAVQWEAIKEAKKRGMKVYNFWGIAPEGNEKHPWRGITLFKKGFGGREIQYIHAQDIPISPFYMIPRSVEHIRRLVRGYD